MSGELSQGVHWVKGFDPVADFNDSTKYTAGVNCKGYNKAVFLMHKGVGTTGTATMTVLAGSDYVAQGATGPTASTAIPFRYKAITTSDTEGAFTDVAAAGVATVAGSSQIYVIEVDLSQLGDTGYNFLYLKMVEVVNDPVLGGILIGLYGARYAQDIPATVLA